MKLDMEYLEKIEDDVKIDLANPDITLAYKAELMNLATAIIKLQIMCMEEE